MKNWKVSPLWPSVTSLSSITSFFKKNCCKKMHLKVSFEWISFLFYWAMREKLDLVLVFKTSVKNFPLIYICLKCSTAYNFDITLTKVERYYSKIVKKEIQENNTWLFFWFSSRICLIKITFIHVFLEKHM